MRNTFKYTARQHWGQVSKALKDVYQAPSPEAAGQAFAEFEAAWGGRYPAVAAGLGGVHPVPVPAVGYQAPGVHHEREFLNARFRQATRCGHFPNEQAALKCLCLVTRSLDPTGTGRTRWAMRWKPALNAFAITFGDRFPAAETY